VGAHTISVTLNGAIGGSFPGFIGFSTSLAGVDQTNPYVQDLVSLCGPFRSTLATQMLKGSRLRQPIQLNRTKGLYSPVT